MTGAEEVRRLLDNGYRVLLFVDGLGEYSALAVRGEESVDAALAAWDDHEPPATLPPKDLPYDGPNRLCGHGLTVADALHAVAEKVILRQLPPRD